MIYVSGSCLERYPNYSGEDKQVATSLVGTLLSGDEATSGGAGQKKRRAPEDCLAERNKHGTGRDKLGFY